MPTRLRQLYEYAIKYAVEHYLPWTYKDCYIWASRTYRTEVSNCQHLADTIFSYDKSEYICPTCGKIIDI